MDELLKYTLEIKQNPGPYEEPVERYNSFVENRIFKEIYREETDTYYYVLTCLGRKLLRNINAS